MFSELKLLFAEKPRVRLAVVFGSAARGALKPESDIDVAVLHDSPLSSSEKRDLVEQLAVITGRAVDLIDLATVGQPLLGQIIKDATRLKGSNSQFAQLMARNAFEQADFMPYVTRLLKTRRMAWTG
jgi:predicted nucleotidyltransferase